ncbi:MAG: hypothetical protein BZY88_11810 [SAR202 cluster bacterium Io17-Chloro-G9]|nr:MAG: hypothetical protein BZY88_11810 [SAR202 cluster bacterium Io17-Chloro-G9]
MGASIRLGRILGIPVEVNVTWIFIFLLITYLLSNVFHQAQPFWPPAQLWSVSVFTSLLFFVSVLAHELSHSVVAVRIGIPVHKITLFVFGGVSQLAYEARRPRSEFLVAVVGPLSSLALSGVFGGLWYLLDDAYSGVGTVLLLLAWVNLSLGVFNMLPGFPLDGGRVLRSALWGLTGSYWRATQVAARGGQVVGGLMVAGGIALAVFSGGIQGAWMAMVGLFLFSAASTSYRQERIREGLRAYLVSDVMSTEWVTLPGDTPVGSPLVAQALGGRIQVLGVQVQGRIEGTVSRPSLDQVPKNRWSQTPLIDVMLPLVSAHQVSPDDSLADVLETMETSSLGGIAVTRHGELVGFVVRRDLLRFSERPPSGRSRWRQA